MLHIAKAGEKVLTQPASKVEVFDSKLESLVSDLFQAKQDYHGAGIAAPQIGVSLQVMVCGMGKNLRYPNEPPIAEMSFINPRIINRSTDEDFAEEGCLSIPHLRAMVPRAKRIELEYYTIQGELKIENYSGFTARVIQHEIDHLHGILFLSRVTDITTARYTEN